MELSIKQVAKIKENVLKVWVKKAGIKMQIAEAVGISRSYLNKLLNEDNDFYSEVMEKEEEILDTVEGQHYNAIMAGNTSNIIFHLKTKGAGRGYQQTNETKLTGAGLSINLSHLSNEALEQIANGFNKSNE